MNYDLMVAVYNSDLEIAQLALQLGADPNHKVDGNTPLLQAIFQEDAPMIELLLHSGADPNLGNPLSNVYDLKVARRLLDAGADGKAAFIHAAEWGNLEFLQLLVDSHQCIEVLHDYDEMGYIPLGCAVALGKVDAVRYLLSLGSDPNRCDPDRIAYTPLATAAEYPEIVQLLLEAGADPHHAWGLCGTGHAAICRQGGASLEILKRFYKTRG